MHLSRCVARVEIYFGEVYKDITTTSKAVGQQAVTDVYIISSVWMLNRIDHGEKSESYILGSTKVHEDPLFLPLTVAVDLDTQVL